MDLVNAIPFFPFWAVTLLMGVVFFIGHITKSRSCDHLEMEFYRLIHDPEKGTYGIEVKCYCGGDHGSILRTGDMTGWGYIFLSVVNASKRSFPVIVLLTFAHLILLLVGVVFVLLKMRNTSTYFYNKALQVEDLMDGDLEKWRYIDRRDEKLSTFLETCDIHVLKLAD